VPGLISGNINKDPMIELYSDLEGNDPSKRVEVIKIICQMTHPNERR
jgi:hypothetical protein